MGETLWLITILWTKFEHIRSCCLNPRFCWWRTRHYVIFEWLVVVLDDGNIETPSAAGCYYASNFWFCLGGFSAMKGQGTPANYDVWLYDAIWIRLTQTMEKRTDTETAPNRSELVSTFPSYNQKHTLINWQTYFVSLWRMIPSGNQSCQWTIHSFVDDFLIQNI